jgi:hypothetical protein
MSRCVANDHIRHNIKNNTGYNPFAYILYFIKRENIALQKYTNHIPYTVSSFFQTFPSPQLLHEASLR